MQNQKPLPKTFQPYVTGKEIRAYDSADPSTHTISPLINAVLDAMEHVRPLNGKTVAEYMGLDSNDLQGALRCITGMGFVDFLNFWRVSRVQHLAAKHPGLVSRNITTMLGFSDRAALWKFLRRNKLVPERNGSHYALRDGITFILKRKDNQ